MKIKSEVYLTMQKQYMEQSNSLSTKLEFLIQNAQQLHILRLQIWTRHLTSIQKVHSYAAGRQETDFLREENLNDLKFPLWEAFNLARIWCIHNFQGSSGNHDKDSSKGIQGDRSCCKFCSPWTNCYVPFLGRSEESIKWMVDLCPLGRIGQTGDLTPIVGLIGFDAGEWTHQG
uniref:Uncharacterized protein n=1 Tax=Kalanchoe fedtschenkoi TaxID=63787 RepID=A0A7N0UTM6_KALFE